MLRNFKDIINEKHQKKVYDNNIHTMTENSPLNFTIIKIDHSAERQNNANYFNRTFEINEFKKVLFSTNDIKEAVYELNKAVDELDNKYYQKIKIGDTIQIYDRSPSWIFFNRNELIYTFTIDKK